MNSVECSIYVDELPDGLQLTQSTFYRWGDRAVIALGELNLPNNWDEEGFGTTCARLESSLRAGPPPISSQALHEAWEAGFDFAEGPRWEKGSKLERAHKARRERDVQSLIDQKTQPGFDLTEAMIEDAASAMAAAVNLTFSAFDDETKGMYLKQARAALETPIKLTDDASLDDRSATAVSVEKILREHIKVDASGFSPAVASALVVGIEDASSAIADAMAEDKI